MNIVNEKDYIQVRTISMIADYDKDILANLYQPIIGFEAFAVYLTLITEAKNQKITPVFRHSELFKRMHITASKFVDARKTLEGIGLIKTYIVKADDYTTYRYDLYSPVSPKKFFSNTLFFGMLIKTIGEKEANKLRITYTYEREIEEGTEISASFKDIFKPNLDDSAFQKALKTPAYIVGHSAGKVNSEFSYEKFFKELSLISNLKEKNFNHEEMEEIERIATLYGADERLSASKIASIYLADSKEAKVDFERFTKLIQSETNFAFISNKKVEQTQNFVNSKTDLASKINIMESVSTKDYLSLLQGGTKPAQSDLTLIDYLSKNFKLKNCVLNALIDFVLAKNDNVLSRPYCEKIAASLKREEVKTAVDAMNYLKKVDSKKAQNKSSKTFDTQVKKSKIDLGLSENDDEEDDISLDELMKSLD